MGVWNRIGFLMLALALTSSSSSVEAGCTPPEWINDPDIPACPTSGSTLVPDTAPPAAIVVSGLLGFKNDPQNTGPASMGYDPLIQFVIESLRASGTKIPKILLKGIPEQGTEFIRQQIDQHCANPANHCQSLQDKWKAALVSVPGKKFQWQQDYFQSTFDPTTGLPVIRPIRDYNHAINTKFEIESLAKTTKDFCISAGKSIPPQADKNYKFTPAAMGGNIEALPGGLCLHGNNQGDWNHFGRYYCGDPKNSVEIDVEWLEVGHVDEVIELVRDAGGHPPCDFAVTWASPKKAFELIKDPKNRDKPFHEDFFLEGHLAWPGVGNNGRELLERTKKLRESKKGSLPAEPNPAPDASQTKEGAWLIERLLSEAWADGTSRGEHTLFAPALAFPTNAEVAEFLESDGYNALIQKKMEANVEKIKQKLIERTGCSQIQFVPVPNLFMGGEPIEQRPEAQVTVNGKKRRFGDLTEEERKKLAPEERYVDLPHGRAKALLPNPTNSVLIGKTVLGSKQWNPSFSSYLRNTYGRLGLEYKEVDTSDAHSQMGNLHCSTNTLRVCRPATQPAKPDSLTKPDFRGRHP